MDNYDNIKGMIDAFRSKNTKGAILPEMDGAIMQAILDFAKSGLDNATALKSPSNLAYTIGQSAIIDFPNPVLGRIVYDSVGTIGVITSISPVMITTIAQSSAQLSMRITTLEKNYTSLLNKTSANDTNLQNHIQSDLPHWQDLYDLEADYYAFKASVLNQIDGTSETITTPYQVDNILGGRVDFIMGSLLGLLSVTATVNITRANGTSISWSSPLISLLTPSESLKKSFILNDGDIISFTNMSSATFTPYIPK